ncbi:MAG TPA: hypothetical protein VLG48_09640, partial [Candidatus Methylomirabilis sp.]|nr:hypothetical protein [Candidatus Methylomirabilis sp.]
DATAAPASPPASPPSAEEQLIYIGLNYPAWREWIASSLAPEDVRDTTLRQIFTEFIRGEAALGIQKTPRPMSLQPPEVQRRLSSLWARDPWSAGPQEGGQGSPEEADPEALQRTVNDCLARITQGRSAVERRALRQALEAAERGGDPDQILRLLSEHPSVKRGREGNV